MTTTEPGGMEAVEITLGEGLVDITRIDHEGRSGVLFRPRANHIAFGEPGELPEGEYWPVKGDVVLWVSGEGPGVAIKALSQLATARPAITEDMIEAEARRIAALEAERDADKSCIEADSIQISYLRATIVRLEVDNTTLQAENARLTEERDAAIKVQEMAAMSGGFHARSAENAERQRDAAEARVSELEAENARLLKAMTEA